MRPAATRKLIAASRGDEFSPNSTSIGDERGKEPRMTDRLIARSRSTIVLVAGAVAAWAVTVDRMRGMDAGPGTDLGGLGWYVGIWVTMTAAMMLPSAAPAARLVAGPARRGSRDRRRRTLRADTVEAAEPSPLPQHSARRERIPARSRARRRLRRLFRSFDGGPVRAGCDEPLLDGG